MKTPVNFQEWKLIPVGLKAKKFNIIDEHSVKAEIQSSTQKFPETIIIAQDANSRKIIIHFMVEDHRGKYSIQSSEYRIIQMTHDFDGGNISILAGNTLKSIFTRILNKEKYSYKLKNISFGSDKLVYITYELNGHLKRIPLLADASVNMNNVYLKQTKLY